jgi:hypothetical protein
MEHSSWETDSHSAGQEIRVNCHVQKNPPLGTILSQINPIHILTPNFLKWHLNITLPLSLFMELKVHYCVQKSPPLSQINPLHINTPYFFKLHLNITSPFLFFVELKVCYSFRKILLLVPVFSKINPIHIHCFFKLHLNIFGDWNGRSSFNTDTTHHPRRLCCILMP